MRLESMWPLQSEVSQLKSLEHSRTCFCHVKKKNVPTQWLYVTEDDIKNLPCFQNETLIAIKAPHGTTLEVPDPDDAVEYPQRRYQILLHSTMGPIDVYLVSRFEGRLEEMNGAEMPMELVTPVAASPIPGNRPIPLLQGDMLSNMDPDPSSPSTQLPISPDYIEGILQIKPSELNANTDYWLLADGGVGITDMWRSDPTNCMWEEVAKLNVEFGIDDEGSAYPQTPTAQNEVASMS
ncbi:hypothetical protein O6H91_Y155400 [Diphasiastrum complanatum]|nr:hypothetical protein O6H91_Y155400 [Diphasiastrum complanatum]